jgi:hypothetical protein
MGDERWRKLEIKITIKMRGKFGRLNLANWNILGVLGASINFQLNLF